MECRDTKESTTSMSMRTTILRGRSRRKGRMGRHRRPEADQRPGLQRPSVPNLLAPPEASLASSATREYSLHRYLSRLQASREPLRAGTGSCTILGRASVGHLRRTLSWCSPRFFRLCCHDPLLGAVLPRAGGAGDHVSLGRSAAVAGYCPCGPSQLPLCARLPFVRPWLEAWA